MRQSSESPAFLPGGEEPGGGRDETLDCVSAIQHTTTPQQRQVLKLRALHNAVDVCLEVLGEDDLPPLTRLVAEHLRDSLARCGFALEEEVTR